MLLGVGLTSRLQAAGWRSGWLAGWDVNGVNGVKRPNGGPITSRLQAAGWRSGWLAGCWLVGWQACKDF